MNPERPPVGEPAAEPPGPPAPPRTCSTVGGKPKHTFATRGQAMQAIPAEEAGLYAYPCPRGCGGWHVGNRSRGNPQTLARKQAEYLARQQDWKLRAVTAENLARRIRAARTGPDTAEWPDADEWPDWAYRAAQVAVTAVRAAFTGVLDEMVQRQEHLHGKVDAAANPAQAREHRIRAQVLTRIRGLVDDLLPAAPCCDMHNRHCEPPGELCCNGCTEAGHDTFPVRHADGSTCVLAAGGADPP